MFSNSKAIGKNFTRRILKGKANASMEHTVASLDTADCRERKTAKADIRGFALLFNNLVPELRKEVLCQMDLNEIFSMRLVCRMFYASIDSNQASIVRGLVKYAPLRRFAMLYRSLAVPMPHTLDQLFSLSHRLHVVNHLADYLARLMVTTLHRIPPSELVKHPYHLAVTEKMVRKMQPYLLILFHFLETYRAELAETVATCDTWVKTEIEVIHRKAEARIARQYNGHVIHNFFSLSHFLIKIIERKLRPASYAGILERRLRGWSTEPATAAECMRLLVIGGLESVHMIISLPKFPERISALKKHLQHLTSKPTDPEPARRFYVMSRNDKIMDTKLKPSAIMPPLDEEIASKLSQVLPEREDFLNIQRLAALFEPDVVLVDEVQSSWDFARLLIISEDMDSDFALEAGAPVLPDANSKQ